MGDCKSDILSCKQEENKMNNDINIKRTGKFNNRVNRAKNIMKDYNTVILA